MNKNDDDDDSKGNKDVNLNEEFEINKPVIADEAESYGNLKPDMDITPDINNTPNSDDTYDSEINNNQTYIAPPLPRKLTEEEKERINKYKKFKKVDGAAYKRINTFLRKHTYITAREWAIARLCADFSTRGGAEMTFIGENLPELVPFMTDTYSPQAVNQARSSFKKKVKKSGATFFYGALCGFFTADELDDILFESSEVARFLLEIEGTSVDIDDEIETEDRITDVMRSVAEAASMIRQPRQSSDSSDNTHPPDNIQTSDNKDEITKDNKSEAEENKSQQSEL
ncbi:MAG: DUF5806 family protein [Methanomicrobium sp.]|nr:DUF5806 family protein [Methanomicrobium sp.]